MTIEDEVLRELHRAASDAGRSGVAVPSIDLDVVASRLGRRDQAQKALERLAAAGRVERVRRDLVLPTSTGLRPVDLDGLVDAIAPRPYLITGGRALEHVDLTDQHYFGVVVLVPEAVAPLRYRGQTATFFRTDKTNIWGWRADGGPHYALPERAIVDVVSHPRYGVSLSQASDALVRATTRDPKFLDRLRATVFRYGAGARGHGAKAAARRIGYVVEQIFGADAAAPFVAGIGTNRSFVPLRPSGPDDGPVDAKWRVIVNATVEPEKVR